MPNLRVLNINYADQATSLTANSTAGSLAAALMLTDEKTEAHRSVGTSVVYTLTWTNAITVGLVALPATNLRASDTVTVQLYSNTAATTLIASSGAVTACPGLDLGLWTVTTPITANHFPYGGASKSAVWFTTQPSTIKAVKITITSTGNPAGFIDCARLIVGPYWEPTINADYGASYQLIDDTKNSRADSGSLYSDRAPMSESLTLRLSNMDLGDRANLVKLMRANGVWKPVFISVFPEDGTDLEQTYMVYGKRKNGAVDHPFFRNFVAPLELEGW